LLWALGSGLWASAGARRKFSGRPKAESLKSKA
jgi:hypothetical protein